MIVIPSNREEQLQKILPLLLTQDKIIVCEDNEKKTFNLPGEVEHYSHEEIKDELGDNAWIISKKNASIRSFGFYKAWQKKAEYIITIDDDCIPDENFVERHIIELESSSVSTAWTNTINGTRARGMPFYNIERTQETLINHGLWEGVPDLSAIGQIHHKGKVELINQTIPKGQFFPMSGMNLSFKSKATPAMYFLLMGQGYEYDRYDDIWAGLFVKKICDHLNYGVKSGNPYIFHSKASDVWANLKKEASGLGVNETLWDRIDKIILTSDTIKGCYKELSGNLPEGDYWQKLKNAMDTWVNLFNITG